MEFNDLIDKIYNMDCLEGMKQIPDNSIDLVVTDPPYNTGMQANNAKARLSHFFNDKFPPEIYKKLAEDVCKELFRVLKQDKGIYIYMNWKSLSVWIENLEKAGFKVKNVIIWDKVVHGLNYQNYAYTYEMIIFATKGTFFPHNKKDGNKFYRDIWHIKRNLDNESEKIEHHETQKAIEVVKLPLKHASKPGDIILDPFMGSGTTAVACLMLNRHFIGFELEKKYCDIANMRIKEYMKQTNLMGNLIPTKPDSGKAEEKEV